MYNCLCLIALPTCSPLRQKFPDPIVNASFPSLISNMASTVLLHVPARQQPSLQLIPSNNVFLARCPQWFIPSLGMLRGRKALETLNISQPRLSLLVLPAATEVTSVCFQMAFSSVSKSFKSSQPVFQEN